MSLALSNKCACTEGVTVIYKMASFIHGKFKDTGFVLGTYSVNNCLGIMHGPLPATTHGAVLC